MIDYLLILCYKYRFKYFKPIKLDKNEIVNVTGAGDR